MRERERIEWVYGLEDQAMSAADELKLDAMLAEQEDVRNVVQNMAEDTVSLAWRSKLNQQLFEEQSKTKRTSWLLTWKPAAGLAIAGALAMVAIMQRPLSPVQTQNTQSSIESQLLEAHDDSVTYREISGAGLSIWETERTTSATPEGYDWQDVDLDTL